MWPYTVLGKYIAHKNILGEKDVNETGQMVEKSFWIHIQN